MNLCNKSVYLVFLLVLHQAPSSIVDRILSGFLSLQMKHDVQRDAFGRMRLAAPSRPPVNFTLILSFTYFDRSRMASLFFLSSGDVWGPDGPLPRPLNEPPAPRLPFDPPRPCEPAVMSGEQHNLEVTYPISHLDGFNGFAVQRVSQILLRSTTRVSTLEALRILVAMIEMILSV